ncbi:MAG: NUDIX hydrolase [Parcubacteria group bacterium]|nr:NUDIX hydrolase [Parcubacteria group bacterium]
MARQSHKLTFAVLATDTVLFTVDGHELKVLLMRVHRPPHVTRHWGVPGGLIHPKETADQAAQRHLREKGGVTGVYLEQLYTFSRVDRDPRGRVVSVAYLGLVPGVDISKHSDGEVGWFPVRLLPALAYDHREIIRTAVERLKAKLEYTNIAYRLVPEAFTLTELQRVYEVIIGRKLDKRNFRKKLFFLNLLEKVGRKKKSGASRPAELYRFRERKPRMVPVLAKG